MNLIEAQKITNKYLGMRYKVKEEYIILSANAYTLIVDCFIFIKKYSQTFYLKITNKL